MAEEGLVTVPSAHGVGDTLARLHDEIVAAGMTVFAQVDHAAGAASVGMDLRPTTVVMFGSPKGGTPLMADNQTAGIDLPLKVLVWEDAAGRVLVSYNDPHWIARRHGIGAGADAAVDAMAAGLSRLTAQATQ